MEEDEVESWESSGTKCKLWQMPNGAYRGAVFEGTEPVACAEVAKRFGEERARAAVDALVPVMSKPSGHRVISDQTPITDLVFVPLASNLRRDKVDLLARPVNLAPDIQAIPATWELAREVFAACDPPGKHRSRMIDLRAPLYAIVRHSAPRDPLHKWDSDGRLQLCIALSRLVRPTSIALGHTVRVIGDLSSRQHQIIPGPIHDFGARAWTPRPARDWLDVNEFGTLRQLLAAFTRRPFARRSRLKKALWYFEYCSRIYYTDIRWTLMTTVAETLLSTSDDATRNFVKRLPQVATRLDVRLRKEDASKMWRIRSGLVHGGSRGLRKSDLARYARLEDVVRTILRTAILSPPFRRIFASAESIDRAFPVEPRPPRTVACPRCQAVVPVPGR